MLPAGGVSGGGGAGGSSLVLLLLAAGCVADRYSDYTGVKLPSYEYEETEPHAPERTEYRDYDRLQERRRRPATREPPDDADDDWRPPSKARHVERPRRPTAAPLRREPLDEPQELDDSPAYKSLDDKYRDDINIKPKYKRRRSKGRRDIGELTRALAGERVEKRLESHVRGRRDDDSDSDYTLPPPGDDQYPHGMDLPPADGPPHTTQPPTTRPPRAMEGSDYDSYGMNHVHRLKDKLPSLLRRTTQTPAFEAPRRKEPRRKKLGRQELRRNWLANRRFDGPPPTPESEKTSPTTTTTTTTASTTTTAATTVALLNATRFNFSELLDPRRKLSLAEKSRLSILKKSMIKESKESGTEKPPVLIQVTGGSQTVVMVEPQGTKPPYSERLRRYQLAVEQSPQQLAQVKRLMRTKLLERARGISDLTDNWDEQVCDYIDTSLIKNAASTISATRAALAIACVFFVIGLSLID